MRKHIGVLAGGLVMLAARLAHAVPQPETGIGLPRDASYDGNEIDWLIQITGVFTLILFVIMVFWMVWAAVKHGKEHTAEYDHGDSKHSVKVALAVSAVIFFIVDGNLWVDSTLDVNGKFWNFASADEQPDVVRIEVNAHQWAWDARYAGPDGKFSTPDDAVILNDVWVPVDAPVVIQIASVDVIHSFYLPNFRVKTDAVPGTINSLTFKAKLVGDYDIGCAQHCGPNHYKMKGTLHVVAKEDYRRWLERASALSNKAYNPDDTLAHWGWEWKEYH